MKKFDPDPPSYVETKIGGLEARVLQLEARIGELMDMVFARNTLIIDKNQQITNLTALWTACKEQVDVEDLYVHDLTSIIEAMEALEDHRDS
jgi:hypothetical protein